MQKIPIVKIYDNSVFLRISMINAAIVENVKYETDSKTKEAIPYCSTDSLNGHKTKSLNTWITLSILLNPILCPIIIAVSNENNKLTTSIERIRTIPLLMVVRNLPPLVTRMTLRQSVWYSME